MSIGGIYEILNTVNGKRYIGSAVNLVKREREHFRDLARRKHKNKKLQSAWNKHGAGSFDFRPVMVVLDRPMLISWEQKFIDEFKPEYNLNPSAGSSLGMKHSPEARAKMSRALVGNTRSLGHVHTPEWCAKNSARQMGHTRGLGSKRSPETCAKNSAQLIGNTRGRGLLGIKRSAETREKMSKARRRIAAYKRLMACQGALA